MEKIINKNKYCNSLTSYSRWGTQEVEIGDVALGGSNPIRVQSMTTTNTMDTMATVEQSIHMIEAGCEYVRITAPSKNEAQNLANIKKELKSFFANFFKLALTSTICSGTFFRVYYIKELCLMFRCDKKYLFRF